MVSFRLHLSEQHSFPTLSTPCHAFSSSAKSPRLFHLPPTFFIFFLQVYVRYYLRLPHGQPLPPHTALPRKLPWLYLNRFSPPFLLWRVVASGWLPQSSPPGLLLLPPPKRPVFLEKTPLPTPLRFRPVPETLSYSCCFVSSLYEDLSPGGPGDADKR